MALIRLLRHRIDIGGPTRIAHVIMFVLWLAAPLVGAFSSVAAFAVGMVAFAFMLVGFVEDEA